MIKRNFTLWFLRRFSRFREFEMRCEAWKQSLELSEKKAESDTALITSLNRYIEALEGKAAMQAEVIQELRGHLSGASLPPQ